jgi:chitinase
MADIRARWNARSPQWGLSFTAPTSYWYMRWFDIGNMTRYADWVNLMTYDLHGSWDSPEDQIGSFVYAHTNLTEIGWALDLLWRNSVPANKVNLGIGFYGRTFTLADKSCTSPGCPFSSAGAKGGCTGVEGTLSFKEITDIRNQYHINTVHDEVAKVNYFAYNGNQWLSYDDVVTLKEKVDYANSQGLLGLFIWAVDQDTDKHDALNAVLDRVGGLGAFNQQNGVGPANTTDWTPATGLCFMGGCGLIPGCPNGYTAIGHQVRCDDNKHRRVCCPSYNAPTETSCQWRSGKTAAMHPRLYLGF